MSAAGRGQTVFVGLLMVLVGFVAGAAGSAWRTRDVRAEPWRKMRVEHEGTEGATTRTRVIFENPKLALQAVEVIRSPAGKPELAHVALRDGQELTIQYGEDSRPWSMESADGSRALLNYKDDKAWVAFFTPKAEKVGSKLVAVPVELRSALRLSRADEREPSALPDLWAAITSAFVGQAWAQEPEDEPIQVKREVEVSLDVRVPGAKAGDPGNVEVEASCPPFACVPLTPEVPMPGQSTVRVAVAGSAERSKLSKPTGGAALDRFRKVARDERSVAGRVLPDASAVVAAVGVVATACKSLKLAWPICVPAMAKSTTASGPAVVAVSTHDIKTGGLVIDERAEQLYYQDQARATLDREASIQVCVSRSGFARACTKLAGRPFGAQPMARAQRSVELRRGIGGTLEGSFVMTQSDGADCKFSPSPRTSGALRLTFDNQRKTATGTLKANQRGTRANMSCSLGTANMSWSQNYGVTVTQSFTAEQLESGGKLALRMTGTMTGTGGYSFSNCRSSGGASANCPGGKSDSYTYQVELTGELNLDTQTGGGRILVRNAPMATNGTWRTPARVEP